MIIKPFEKRDADIAELTRLTKLPQVSAKTKADIEKEIRNIRAGDVAEAETAYEIDFMRGSSKSSMIIHGLRLEHEGRVAQIDHLMINRVLDAYVVESKSFTGGLSVNEQGEFCTFYNNRPISVPSPIAQNQKHIDVLKAVYASDAVAAPMRLGFRLPLSAISVISVRKNARITRPEKKIKGLYGLIKSDQFKEFFERDIDENTSILEAAKMVSSETLQKLAHAIVAQHKPIQFNWAGKFGITEAAPKVSTFSKTSTPAKAKAEPSVCAVCDEPLHWTIVKWCRRNSKKYEGMLLCRDHQKNVVLSIDK